MSPTKIGIILNKLISLDNKDTIFQKKRYKLGIKNIDDFL